MTEKRCEIRSLCADIVKLEWKDKAGWMRTAPAVLEDISPRGACLQVEFPVSVNVEAWIRHGENWVVPCRTAYCVYREIGYFTGVEFSPGIRWSRRAFRPGICWIWRNWCARHGIKVTRKRKSRAYNR